MGLLVTPLKFSIAVLAMVVGLAHPASAQTDRRLLQKTSLDFDNATIGDVLKDLAERHKLTLAVSPEVQKSGFDQRKVVIQADGLTLGSALSCLARCSGAVCILEKGELKVVTREVEEQSLYPATYSMAGWGSLFGDAGTFKTCLYDATGGLWKEVDGEGGSVGDFTPQGVIVEQNRETHAEIRQLLADIANQAGGRKATPAAADRVGMRIAQALQRPLKLGTQELPLPEFCKQILGDQKIGWQIDVTGLTDEGIAADEVLVKIPGGKTPVGKILGESLKSRKLAFWIVDEVVFVTTQGSADQMQTARVYNVGKRLNPMVTMTGLMQQLQGNPELGPWEQVDGEGGAMFPLGPLLIIRQSAAKHDMLAELLR